MMNKYMGFYELREISIPTVPWQLFTADTGLDSNLLWTVRVAVEGGNDLNLPRAVGVSAEEAVKKGRELLKEYSGKGIVIVYPYFIAQKSGMLDISSTRTVIEAVNKDLWNLVTYGSRNMTAVFPFGLADEGAVQMVIGRGGSSDSCSKSETSDMGGVQIFGDEAFLDTEEQKELLKYSAVLRGRFREKLSEGKSIFAEWSYAFRTDMEHEPIGDRYLVFYELRVL